MSRQQVVIVNQANDSFFSEDVSQTGPAVLPLNYPLIMNANKACFQLKITAGSAAATGTTFTLQGSDIYGKYQEEGLVGPASMASVISANTYIQLNSISMPADEAIEGLSFGVSGIGGSVWCQQDTNRPYGQLSIQIECSSSNVEYSVSETFDSLNSWNQFGTYVQNTSPCSTPLDGFSGTTSDVVNLNYVPSAILLAVTENTSDSPVVMTILQQG